MLRLHLLGRNLAGDKPTLVGGQWPGLSDLDQVANVAGVLSVMRLELGSYFVLLAVNRVLFEGVHGDYHGLVHLIGDDCPPKCADHSVASIAVISRSQAMVSARAIVFLCAARVLTFLISLVRLSITALASASR